MTPGKFPGILTLVTPGKISEIQAVVTTGNDSRWNARNNYDFHGNSSGNFSRSTWILRKPIEKMLNNFHRNTSNEKKILKIGSVQPNFHSEVIFGHKVSKTQNSQKISKFLLQKKNFFLLFNDLVFKICIAKIKYSPSSIYGNSMNWKNLWQEIFYIWNSN